MWPSLKPGSPFIKAKEGRGGGSEVAVQRSQHTAAARAPEGTAGTSPGPRLSGNVKHVGSPGFHYNEKTQILTRLLIFMHKKKYITVLDTCFQPHINLIRWIDFSPSSLTYGLDPVAFEVCGFCSTGSNMLAALELEESHTALLITVHPHAAICLPSF